ncbi:hypothetical protein MCEMSEM23_03277 [Rhabdaerophilaceae bacterium]
MRIKELRQLGKNGNPTFEELAAFARAEILQWAADRRAERLEQPDSPPKTDWEKLSAPTETKPEPKKDWTERTSAPREFKTLPPRDKTPDRDR